MLVPETENQNIMAEDRGSIPYQPRKSFFIGLMFISVLLLMGFLLLIWLVPTIGLKNIHPFLPFIFGSTVVVSIGVILGGVVLITASILRGKDVLFSSRLRGLLIRIFLPLMTLIGRMIKIPREKIQESFIDINNQLVRSQGHRLKPERILILMPHCIQYLKCRIKVTLDIKNCVMCGKCEIKDLNELAEEFNINIFVSNGGTMARRLVEEKRPNAIVAVACERDLTSGIQDAYPLPVIGIVNKRPKGYCISTGVDVMKVREAIRYFLEPSS